MREGGRPRRNRPRVAGQVVNLTNGSRRTFPEQTQSR
jgi:hypothetical protein